MLQIRTAVPQDACELLKIYAPYVKDTMITFEYEVPSAEEFRERILRTLERYPYLVAEDTDGLLGFSFASPFKERAAYAWSAETSIYIRMECRRRGVGKALYTALENFLARQHVCNLCACISYPHPESIAFHESFGYHMAAHFTASGFKAGRWQDIVWMEKELSPHQVPPSPFIPFSALSK
nr:GNAT family N-acetyltransferase [uncultured Acetatifactor sp.]